MLLGKCQCGVRWASTADNVDDVPRCRCGAQPSAKDVRLADKIIREQAFAMRQAGKSGAKAPRPDWFFLAR